MILGEANWVKKGNQEVYDYKWIGDLSNQKLVNAIVYNQYFSDTALISRAQPVNSPDKLDVLEIKKSLNLK